MRNLVEVGLDEDHAREDASVAVSITRRQSVVAMVRSREHGVVSGLEAVPLTFAALGAEVHLDPNRDDGDVCEPGDTLVTVRASIDDLLRCERTFLNVIGGLSGIASLARRFADAAGPACRVLDTRKTWPGVRALQKYAVRCGGGFNHRMHLADAIMIKDNHRWGQRSVPEMLRAASEEFPDLDVIVEVDTTDQLRTVLLLRPTRVLLDNFDAVRVATAVALRDELAPGLPLEVSGGVNLDTVGELARAGADFVSVGALTHSAAAMDVGLDIGVEE